MVKDHEKGRNSPGKSTPASNHSKDGWDKAEILFKFLGTIVAAGLVATFGILGNNYLQEKQRIDSDLRLYTQLLSNKEASENTLRKDMFGHILKSFLVQEDEKAAGKQATLQKIRKMQLNLELISRNFHESLDMKPLFKHLLMEIIRPMVSINRCLKKLSSAERSEDLAAAMAVCGQAQQLTNENLEIDFKMMEDAADHKSIDKAISKFRRLLKSYDMELEQLVQTAKRVTRKQREILEEVAGKMKLEIPLLSQPADKICTEYSPMDWLPKKEGTCRIDEQDVAVEGVSAEGTLAFKTANGQEDASTTRYFKIMVRYLYPRWRQIYVEVLTCPEKVGCEERKKDDPQKDTASFWLEYFDFPLVDHTYLDAGQRYSLVLEGFTTDQNGEDVKAEITLLYYPASYAGLKEKSFYNNQLMQTLLKSRLFGHKEKQNMSDLVQ